MISPSTMGAFNPPERLQCKLWASSLGHAIVPSTMVLRLLGMQHLPRGLGNQRSGIPLVLETQRREFEAHGVVDHHVLYGCVLTYGYPKIMVFPIKNDHS